MSLSIWVGEATCIQCGYLMRWMEGYEPEDLWCWSCHEPLVMLAPKWQNLPCGPREGELERVGETLV